MLRIDNQNINFNGASVVNDDTIATFGAGYSGTDIWFNFNIPNIATYKTNKSAFDTDLLAFKDQVVATVEDLAE